MPPIFDPDTFLSTSVGGKMETERTLIEAKTYSGTIVKLEPKEGKISKGRREGEPWASMNFTFEVDDPEQARALNRDGLLVNYNVFLDLNPDGSLATGTNKNVDLGRLRAALGLNTDSTAWGDFIGGRALVQVIHEVGPSGRPYESVKAVAKES